MEDSDGASLASPSGPNSGSGAPLSSNSSNPKLRKRTKTGCLTCRKRRIKCGEERPTCANCIKSKRHCEGYNQRIIFKTNMEGLPGVSTIPYHTSTIPGSHHQFSRSPGYSPGDIFSMAPSQRHYGIPLDEYGNPISMAPHFGSPSDLSTPQYHLPSFNSSSHQRSINGFYQVPHSPPEPMQISGAAPFGPSQHPPQISPLSPPHQFMHGQDHDNIPTQPFPPIPHRPAHTSSHETAPQYFTQPKIDTPPETAQPVNLQNPMGRYFESQQSSEIPEKGIKFEDSTNFTHHYGTSRIGPENGHAKRRTINRQFPGAPIDVMSSTSPPESSVPTYQSPLDLNEAAREYQFDSAESDDDDAQLSMQDALYKMHNEKNWKLFSDLHSREHSDIEPRGYRTFIHEGMLNTYDAENYASPLKNTHTARVFLHFLSATSLSISIFERQPNDLSGVLDSAGWNAQGLWTSTLPLMALNHQGLLHAMLALSSLHIAKLQNGPTSPAMKHYTYSIKRIHNSVGKRNKRHLTTTLAATLLLAFYEVMTADHSKWCWHLRGASLLIKETDFRRMAYRYKVQEAEMQAQEDYLTYGDTRTNRRGSTSPLIVDDGLLNRIVGKDIHWRPPSNGAHAEEPFDAEKFQIYQALFWWYARQDTYQSIISGNRLLLDYGRWADCPPRAGVGKVQAVYGSHDHVILLFARIADFGAKDRNRKLNVMETTGKKWRHDLELMKHLEAVTGGQGSRPGPPQNGMRPTGAPSPSTGTSSPAPKSEATPPPFFGMAPMPTKVTAPEAYEKNATTPPYESSETSDEHDDLLTKTQEALAEWENIYTALEELGSHLGPSFQPLPDDLLPDIHSPYGKPKIYPSFDIAVIWALYFSAYIYLIRSHPSMPPFSLVASNVAAPYTEKYAMLVGQIAAGMMPQRLEYPLHPGRGATLCEVMVPCFVAGVQFMRNDQRVWLVEKAKRLEELTGWGSVGMVGEGCETAWERMAELGKGPPYRRFETTVLGQQDVTRFPRLIPSPTELGVSEEQQRANLNEAKRFYYAVGVLGRDRDH